MTTNIIMPQLGESVVDGTVEEWLVQVGDTIEEYDSIVRVSTDKVDTEIPAPASGVLLAINIEEGQTVDSGVVLGVIGQAGENTHVLPTPRHQANGNHQQAQPVLQTNRAGYSGHVTPVVMRMAQEHNLDLSQIVGTGRNGRIRKKDVLAYLNSETTPVTQPEETTLAPWEIPGSGDLFSPAVEYTLKDPVAKPEPVVSQPTPPPAPIIKSEPKPAPAIEHSLPGELQALTGMRRNIAQHMVKSKLQTAPHATTVFEVDLSAVVKHRNEHKEAFTKQNVKLTYTPYFVAACAQALQQFPAINARWTDDGIYYHHTVNVGIAVALDDGLIVPVVKNAQDYNLVGLARRVNDLADRARNKRLQPDEVRDGTFTITNHGVNGSLFATPIINQPQSAILGLGAIEKRVKVVDDAIAIRPCCYLSLTFDHRGIDGATADAFMMALKDILENWV